MLQLLLGCRNCKQFDFLAAIWNFSSSSDNFQCRLWTFSYHSLLCFLSSVNHYSKFYSYNLIKSIEIRNSHHYYVRSSIITEPCKILAPKICNWSMYLHNYNSFLNPIIIRKRIFCLSLCIDWLFCCLKLSSQFQTFVTYHINHNS